MAEHLRERGWDEAELARRRKGDPKKVEIARRLRAQTTMTLAWIARNLSMGTAGSLANRVRNHPE